MPESPNAESPNAESLILGVTDGVAVLTLNRPRAKNALDSDMMRVGMPDFVRRAREDDAIRAVVIAGPGGDFCSGAAVKPIGGASPPSSDTPRAGEACDRTFGSRWCPAP